MKAEAPEPDHVMVGDGKFLRLGRRGHHHQTKESGIH